MDHVLMTLRQILYPSEIHMVMYENHLRSFLTMIELFRDHSVTKLRRSSRTIGDMLTNFVAWCSGG